MKRKFTTGKTTTKQVRKIIEAMEDDDFHEAIRLRNERVQNQINRRQIRIKTKDAPDVERARIVTEVKVIGSNERRPVFYALRPRLFDEDGVPCQTPTEFGAHIGVMIEQRETDAVMQLCWDALNFVFNGDVPPKAIRRMRKLKPRPLLLYH